MRILLKLSGEALMGKNSYGIDPDFLGELCQKIVVLHGRGIQIGIVVWGGNIFRGLGAGAKNMRRNNADTIGMIATVINCVALQDAFVWLGKKCEIYTAKKIDAIWRLFVYEDAMRDLEDGKIVVFGWGIGNPFFTTDTAGVMRALELDCDCMIKATNVDYIYDKDPQKHTDAVPLRTIDYTTILEKRIGVMDMTAISLARDNALTLYVVNIATLERIEDILEKRDFIGTKIG